MRLIFIKEWGVWGGILIIGDLDHGYGKNSVLQTRIYLGESLLSATKSRKD